MPKNQAEVTSEIVDGNGELVMLNPVAEGLSRANIAQAMSWSDLAEMFGGTENLTDAADEIGDGVELIENKDDLIGVPFIVMRYDVRESEKFQSGDGENSKAKYVSVSIMLENGAKCLFNDGSTGVMADLLDWTERTGKTAFLLVGNGLRRSDFTTTQNINGHDVEIEASVYRFDTRKRTIPSTRR